MHPGSVFQDFLLFSLLLLLLLLFALLLVVVLVVDMDVDMDVDMLILLSFSSNIQQTPGGMHNTFPGNPSREGKRLKRPIWEPLEPPEESTWKGTTDGKKKRRTNLKASQYSYQSGQLEPPENPLIPRVLR